MKNRSKLTRHFKKISAFLAVVTAMVFTVMPGTAGAASPPVIYCNGQQTCTINSGSSVTISWNGGAGATSCSIYNVHSDGFLEATGWSSVTGNASQTLTRSTTYRINCNDGGSNNALVLVNASSSTPYAYPTPAYATPYQTPYPTPYAYPTPAVYPTPYQTPYQTPYPTPYTYPTPTYTPPSYQTPYQSYYPTPYSYQTFYPAPYYYSAPYQQTSNQPSVATSNASNITSSGATLNGSVSGNGLNTAAWFVYGTNTNFGQNTAQNSYGPGSSYYNALISGLAPNTTYYFRAVAQGPQGLVYGNVLSFNTTTGTIFANNQPTVVISADQTNIPSNGVTTIRWYTTGATACNASDGSLGWAGTKSIGPGSFYTGSLTINRTYTITCSNNVGSDSDSVTVTIGGQITASVRPPATSLVLITSSIDRNQPIVPTIDNTRPHPGDEINYTVSYQNIGTGAITNLVLRIVLPLEVDYMFSSPSNPTISGNTLVFNLGTLKASGEGVVTARVRVRDDAPAGTNLNFPATLSYIDPDGQAQSVDASVSAQVWSEPANAGVFLGANVFGTGFLPTNLFEWLLLLILILVLGLLAKYLFDQSRNQRDQGTTPTLQ